MGVVTPDLTWAPFALGHPGSLQMGDCLSFVSPRQVAQHPSSSSRLCQMSMLWAYKFRRAEWLRLSRLVWTGVTHPSLLSTWQSSIPLLSLPLSLPVPLDPPRFSLDFVRLPLSVSLSLCLSPQAQGCIGLSPLPFPSLRWVHLTDSRADGWSCSGHWGNAEREKRGIQSQIKQGAGGVRCSGSVSERMS